MNKYYPFSTFFSAFVIIHGFFFFLSHSESGEIKSQSRLIVVAIDQRILQPSSEKILFAVDGD